jgi:hypothetical protein
MSFLKSFPPRGEILKYNGSGIFDLNGHIHTPFSFSAFENIPQIFSMAAKEKIKAVGINDFIVTDGYRSFHDEAVNAKVFPIFNIEFMGLLKEEQAKGIKVNDPSNPGRTYFSGKGLDFPSHPDGGTLAVLKRVKAESNKQTAEMIAKLDDHLREIGVPFGMSFDEVKGKYAEDLVRERHIAKAVRIKVFETVSGEQERLEMLSKIFGGRAVESQPGDINGLENEIRSRLLKAGSPAYVPEDDNAFLEISQVIDIIIKIGGIPCYPVLLDDKNGNFTDFESDFGGLRDALKSMGVRSIELIPGRNDIHILKRFVKIFHEDDFMITFGTEHNTPELIPLKVDTRGHVDIDDELKHISYQGACVIAAHQYLKAQDQEGYIDNEGACKTAEIGEFRKLGSAVFNYFFAS